MLFRPILALALMACSAQLFAGDEEAIRFLGSHCARCHGTSEENAHIRLDDIETPGGKSAEFWARVYSAVANHEMPPSDEPQPSVREREQLLGWIVDQSAGSTEPAQRRRLNRRELSAALQDLTGLPIDFGMPLPDDPRIDGFDTGAAALHDAPDSVSQWLKVTGRAVDSMRFLEPASGSALNIDFRDHDFNDLRKFLQKTLKLDQVSTKSKRLICKKDVGLFLQTQWSGDRANSLLTCPAPANKEAALKVVMRVRALRPLPQLPYPMLWVSVGGKYVDYVPLEDTAETLTYVVRMEDQLVEQREIKIMLRAMVEVPYAVDGFENDDRSKPQDDIPGGIGMYRPKFDRKQLRTPDVQPVPSIVVECLEIDHDHRVAWPNQETVEKLADDDASAKKLLALWVDKASRRPATEEERLRVFEFYRKLREQGLSFDEGMRAAFQSVLMGVPFRYFGSPADTDEEVAQFAIASRLSFMLTGFPPDDQLRKLGAQRKLTVPRIIDQQVDRLMDSSRSDGFFRPFVEQWLNLDQPITQTMSHLKKQDFRFGRHLKASMKEETIQYVARLFRENRPANEIVDSDWTMMNDVLAWHYGSSPIKGGRLRRIDIAPTASDGRGGGVLGHAGIQSMLCWMGDNWTIYRGAWLLNHLLDDPLPPPPLEIPDLFPSDDANLGKSVRDLLMQHQQDPNCSVCHHKIDPLGFAFQNFDLSGRWRTVEFDRYHRHELDGKIEWRGEGNSRPVDTKGRLPRGEEFSSFQEAKQLLADKYIDDIVRGLMKKLTLYGTGRQPTVRDLVTIESIMREHSTDGYPMRALLKAFFRSRIFLGSERGQ